MVLQEQIHGFRVTAIKPQQELGAVLYEMEHEKSGARLCWLDRDSDNKTFCIGFRTVPEDDTGVFHILEHSVLCGSEKFPVKEPFVELIKSSLNTFINAFTYPDKTIYPVCSRNDKDFMNLMRVYLDAVFFPAIYEKPEIFYQEGWHYELRPDCAPSYKGVVFNEMKGVFASPDSRMNVELDKRMFPDTCYRFVSGGDPAHIPDLSYEQFLESHRRFYHPSNSYIFLDGNVDLHTVLETMDTEYLSRFSRREMDTGIPMQRPLDGGSGTAYYALSPAESLEKKARVAYGFGLGDYRSRKESVAMSLISDFLCGSNQSPLKQRILEANLAEDMGMGVMDGTLQSYLVIDADNLEEARADEFRKICMEVIRQQVEQGLDHEHLYSLLANMELRLRERDYGYMPQGLGLGLDVLGSWLYGGDPAQNLSIGPLFAELNALVDTGWYEELLKKTVLESKHHASVLLLPSHELADQEKEAEAAHIRKAQETWDAEKMLAIQEKLDAWQASVDSAEDLAKLPGLTLSDIPAEPEKVPTEVAEVAGVPVVRHEMATGGISYWRLYFDVSDYNQEELSYLSFLCQLLGDLGTERYGVLELQKKCNFLMGALGFHLNCFSRSNHPESCSTYLCAAFSALENKLPQAIEILQEIMLSTDFSNEKQLREILQQCRLQMEENVVDAGNAIGYKRVLAGVSAESVVAECSAGFTYLQFLRKLDQDSSTLAGTLKALLERTFTTGRLTLSLTGAQENMPVQQLMESLPRSERKPLKSLIQPWGLRKEGIVIPADISFAVSGGLCPHSGAMQVVTQIASLSYLWNAVRVQGGAYGTGFSVADRGVGVYHSYRDPDALRSLSCFEKTADFIRDVVASGQDLTGAIIGTIAGTQPVLLPGRLGAVADAWYFKDVTYEGRCAFRKAVLETTLEEIAALEAPLRKLSENCGVCVVGAKEQVESCRLDDVYTL